MRSSDSAVLTKHTPRENKRLLSANSALTKSAVDATNEIERLRGADEAHTRENERLRSANSALTQSVDAATNEIERLRGADEAHTRIAADAREEVRRLEARVVVKQEVSEATIGRIQKVRPPSMDLT